MVEQMPASLEETIISYLKGQEIFPESDYGEAGYEENAEALIEAKVRLILEELLLKVNKRIVCKDRYQNLKTWHNQYPLFDLEDFFPDFCVDEDMIRALSFQESLLVSLLDISDGAASAVRIMGDSRETKPSPIGSLCLNIQVVDANQPEAKPVPITSELLDQQIMNTVKAARQGQEEECKKKWNGIRDSLRRARQKRKTKSGQGATSTSKYKYEAILEFLIPYLAERKGLSNIPDKENDYAEPESGNELQQHESQRHESQHQTSESQQQNSIQETQQPPNASNTDEPEETIEPSPMTPATTPTNRVSARKTPLSAGRKRKLNTEVKSQESPSSQLMAYILAEKKAENKAVNSTNTPNSHSESSEPHPVDAFLAGIAPTLKSLDPVRLHAAKGKIFNVVQEYELQQLHANNQKRTTMTYMYPSTAHTSSASTPAHITSSEENQPYADVHELPHCPNHVAPSPNAPDITGEEDADLSFFDL